MNEVRKSLAGIGADIETLRGVGNYLAEMKNRNFDKEINSLKAFFKPEMCPQDPRLIIPTLFGEEILDWVEVLEEDFKNLKRNIAKDN
jgi:hypothetical protein